MRVFVTGGTGFVGPAIVREILQSGHDVTLLVHKDTGPFDEPTPHLAFVRGDVTRKSSFADAVGDHDAFVHLVAIRREFPERGLTFERFHVEATRNAVEAAKGADVKRFIYMSASGVRPVGTGYQRTKFAAEETVKASGMDWTIFRPTFVTGPAENGAAGFDHEFADIVRRTPVLPSFAGGDFTVQPVAKRDVALAFARALEKPKSVGKTYLLAGPDRLTWNEYLRALAEALDKRRVLAPVPEWFILPVAGLLGRYRWFPASRGELENLFQGHAGDASEAAEDLEISFTPFREALREALAVPWGESRRP